MVSFDPASPMPAVSYVGCARRPPTDLSERWEGPAVSGVPAPHERALAAGLSSVPAASGGGGRLSAEGAYLEARSTLLHELTALGPRLHFDSLTFDSMLVPTVKEGQRMLVMFSAESTDHFATVRVVMASTSGHFLGVLPPRFFTRTQRLNSLPLQARPANAAVQPRVAERDAAYPLSRLCVAFFAGSSAYQSRTDAARVEALIESSTPPALLRWYTAMADDFFDWLEFGAASA